MTMVFGNIVVEERVFLKTSSRMGNSTVHSKTVKTRMVVIQVFQ
jgi:hypothetical protein